MFGTRIRRHVLWALMALALLVPAATAVEQIPDLPSDEWQALFVGTKRVGYMHMEMRQDGDVIVTSCEMKVTMRRFRTEVTVRMAEVSRERVDGTPLSFETVQETSGVEIRTTGTIADGKLHLVTEQGGRRREKTVEWNADALFPYALDQKTRSLDLTPGTEVTVTVFSPDVSVSKPTQMTMKVIGPDAVDVLGVKHEAVKVESRVSALPGMTQQLWLDSRGDLLVSEMSLMGLRTVRCTKEYALAKVEPAELMASIMVTPDKPILFAGRLKRLVLKLSTEDGSPFAIEVLSEGHQRVVERTEESVTIEISREAAASEEESLEPYLARSTYLDCEDERIIAAAKAAVASVPAGDEADAWHKARALRRAVHKLIKHKDFAVAIATASEVIETKKGDCTEHAVLLAAMARAQSIPARVAIGLMYIGGRFGYHMWTQVYVGGAWRDLDAVLPGRDFDAAHVRLATSALADGEAMLGLAAFASVFGNLKIEVLEREYMPRKGAAERYKEE